MGIQCRVWFLEVCRRGQWWRMEFDAARFIIQMNADDLGRVAWRQIDSIAVANRSSVAQPEHFAFGLDPLRRAFEQNAAPFFARACQDGHAIAPYALTMRGSVRRRTVRSSKRAAVRSRCRTF